MYRRSRDNFYYNRPRWISVDMKPRADLSARCFGDSFGRAKCSYTLYLGGTEQWLRATIGTVPMSDQDNGDMAREVYGREHQLTKEAILNLLTVANTLNHEEKECDYAYGKMILDILKSPNAAYRPACMKMNHRERYGSKIDHICLWPVGDVKAVGREGYPFELGWRRAKGKCQHLKKADADNLHTGDSIKPWEAGELVEV